LGTGDHGGPSDRGRPESVLRGIDLSQGVSQYIGETKKNLAPVLLVVIWSDLGDPVRLSEPRVGVNSTNSMIGRRHSGRSPNDVFSVE